MRRVRNLTCVTRSPPLLHIVPQCHCSHHDACMNNPLFPKVHYSMCCMKSAHREAYATTETEPCCDKRGLLFFGRRGTWQNVDLHVWSMVWSFDKWMSSGLCPFSWDDWRAKYVKRSKTVGLSDLDRTAVLLGKFQTNVLDYRRTLKRHAPVKMHYVATF